jgi:Asp-tRNA(Asn)/Glu-tRNA(Gln) amidotransferase A subunit family amidase
LIDNVLNEIRIGLLLYSAPLATTAAALHSDQLDIHAYIDELCNRIDAVEPSIQALLSEPGRRERLHNEAEDLRKRFPQEEGRPALYGIPIGVKDIFRVEGFPTRAGSALPAEEFAGPEAACVTALRNAGALILGKTISTEFAYFEPGPTHNPHNLKHTPGGSSSGSAAAVAAGLCPLALGTQTIGSIIRPAAFCGVVGFKPSFGRIPTAGVIPYAVSLDTVGYFTQDIAGIALVAPVLCQHWHPLPVQSVQRLPVLGVPDGPYVAQASAEGLAAFEQQLALLAQAGYTIRRVEAMINIEAINRKHLRMGFAEMALVHADWFTHYAHLYRPRTAQAIREGQGVSVAELEEVRAGQQILRDELALLMANNGIDIWVSPSAPGPAPEGITTTGNALMNLPWTYAGLPVVSLPAGKTAHGLPLGLQCTGAFMTDELLVEWVRPMASLLERIF